MENHRSNRSDGTSDPVLVLMLRLVRTILLIIAAAVIFAASSGRLDITVTTSRGDPTVRHATVSEPRELSQI